jgi:hypothetical protein
MKFKRLGCVDGVPARNGIDLRIVLFSITSATTNHD